MRRRHIICWLMLGFTALLIFCLTEFIRWYGDCYVYRFSFADGKPIGSVADIVSSQWRHYIIMNGRIWVHALCQGFAALWGQTAFAVCNAAIYVVFILLFTKICRQNPMDIRGLAASILAVLFFSDLSYNPNCQIGYIWTGTVTLAFILEYFRYHRREVNIAGMAGLFLLGLLAGNGNEAISVGTGAALGVDIFRSVFSKRQEERRKRETLLGLSVAQWIMIAGFGVGALMVCLSPGILKRASVGGAEAIWSVYRLAIYSRMLYVLVITLTVLKLGHKIRLREYARGNMFYITALATLLVFNFYIGIGSSNRQLFGVELFSGILTIRAFGDSAVPKWAIWGFTVLAGAIYFLKFDYLRVSNADLRNLRHEVETTDDMNLYIDFHRYSTLVHPTEMENTYRTYFFVAGAFYDDIHDGGNVYRFRNDDGPTPPYLTDDGTPRMRILPTVMREVAGRPERNFTMKCNDGMYLVVRDTLCPRSFYLEREYDIPFLRRAKEPFEIEFVNKDNLDMDGMEIVYTDFDTPFVRNLSIIKN